MPMRNQPPGVHRKARGDERPPREYDIYVDGENAGVMERLDSGEWRARPDGEWPRKFGRRDGYLAGISWLAEVHRAAKKTAEPVTASEGSDIEVLPPVVADPFRDDSFADPLA